MFPQKHIYTAKKLSRTSNTSNNTNKLNRFFVCASTIRKKGGSTLHNAKSNAYKYLLALLVFTTEARAAVVS